MGNWLTLGPGVSWTRRKLASMVPSGCCLAVMATNCPTFTSVGFSFWSLRKVVIGVTVKLLLPSVSVSLVASTEATVPSVKLGFGWAEAAGLADAAATEAAGLADAEAAGFVSAEAAGFDAAGLAAADAGLGAAELAG